MHALSLLIMSLRQVLSVGLFAAFFSLPVFLPPAQAQNLKTELWLASEFQLTLSPETDPNLAWHDIIPDQLRFYTELQEGPVFPDIHQLLWRIGPIWNLTPQFSLAAHFTNSAVQNLENRRFIEEHRLELEPLFRGKFNEQIGWANRHRIEYRVRADNQRFRYRNRLALSFNQPGSDWTPFVSSEFFFDFGGEGLNQNRSVVGVGYQLNPSLRLNLSYMVRFVKQSGSNAWDPIHVAFVSLSYQSQEGGVFQMQSD